MGTLGKVLLFVNLLAAAGLTYFAALDWRQRQEITATALRYHLTLKGLGVDAKADGDTIPVNLELTGGRAAETVRQSLLVEHFKGSEGGGEFSGDPGNPPPGQLAELKRVQDKLDAKLTGLGGAAAQVGYLCGTLNNGVFTPGLLARLANTYEERAAVVGLATAPDAEAAAAQAKEALGRKFTAAQTVNAAQANDDINAVKAQAEAVKTASAAAVAAFQKFAADLQAARGVYDASPKGEADAKAYNDAYEAADRSRKQAEDALRKALDDQSKGLTSLGGTASRDAGDQRRRIARLLGEVDPSAGWQKRAALVVGLRTYREAVGEQVDRLRDMAKAAQTQAVADQAEFNEAYLLLKEQAVARTLQLEQQRLYTADMVARQAKEREATAQRRGQLLARLADLAAVRNDVAEALAKQSEVEAELFAVQQKVGETLRANTDLEKQLQQAEYRALGK